MKNKRTVVDLDILFINPPSRLEVYQKLSGKYAAIEPPTWALLLASSIRKNNFSCEILDCDALRLNDEQSIEEIKNSKCKLACFVLYGQQPNQGTFLMVGATKLAKKLKQHHPEILLSKGVPKEVIEESKNNH